MTHPFPIPYPPENDPKSQMKSQIGVVLNCTDCVLDQPAVKYRSSEGSQSFFPFPVPSVGPGA
jgi:hypothetical protein